MGLKPLERESVIRAIKKAGKEDEFTKGWGRTPKDYFEEYAYLEPEVWYNVLNDLGIPVKDV